MKQAKLFGEEEPTVLTKLELANAQTLAKQVESLNEFTKAFGGSIKTQNGNKRSSKSFFYTATGKDAIKIINAILPYLLIKRQEAELVMSLHSCNNPETLFRKVEEINSKRIRRWNPSNYV